MNDDRYPKALRIWLFAGLVMVTVQILLGGITRLTGSGLSITKWEIVTGTLPPMSQESWQEAFEAYQQTPQYDKINTGMSLSEFKFIYLWEYIHRLWARLMGFVFIIPFIIFWYRKWIDKRLMRKLLLIVGLAGLAASFGWIMVASGLVDRPWVNAYKLTVHLNLGLLLLAVILWTFLSVLPGNINVKVARTGRIGLNVVLTILVVQLLLGGLMSGMKAGLFYPTWPDMRGAFIPEVLTRVDNWNWANFTHYDNHSFASAFVQFFHRLFGYLLLAGVALFTWYVYKTDSRPILKMWSVALLAAVLVQIILGVVTVIHCVGQIPLWLGVLHQFGACLVLVVIIAIKFMVRPE